MQRQRVLLAAVSVLVLVIALVGAPAVFAATNIAQQATPSASSSWPGYGPEKAIDGSLDTNSGRWSGASGDENPEFYLDWGTPTHFNAVILTQWSSLLMTQLTIDAWDGSDWVNVTTVGSGTSYLPERIVAMLPEEQYSQKLRVMGTEISPLYSFLELEVYDGVGTLEGYVTELTSGRGMGGVTVEAGDVSTTTESSGYYSMMLDAGPADLVVSKDYLYATRSTTVVGGETVTEDFQLQDLNLAPLAVASSSSSWSGYGPEKANDGDRTSRYSALTDGDEWFELTWDAEQTFDYIMLYSWNGLIPETMNIQYWDLDESAWKDLASLTPPLYPYSVVSFPPVRTTALHFTNAWTFMEAEVYSNTGNVHGVVTDSATGKPICGAVVEGAFPVTTDASGAYSTSLPEGTTSRLTASRLGYDDAELIVDVPAGGLEYNFTLTSSLTNLVPGATATASSSASGHAAALAIDGDASTQWTDALTPGCTFPSWLVVEWPSAQKFDTVYIPNCTADVIDVDCWLGGDWVPLGRIGNGGITMDSAQKTLSAKVTGASATAVNIAPSAVATSSSHWDGYGPEVGNDGDITTRYSALTGGDEWYELEWSTPQTFTSIELYPWSGSMPSTATFTYWDADTSSWKDIGTMSSIAAPVTTLSFSAVTTTKIHMTNATTFYELKVIQTPTSAVETTKLRLRHVGSIGELEVYNTGTPCNISGTVTDYYTGQPVAGASVACRIGDTVYSEVASDAGTYCLSVPAGSITLNFGHWGYTARSYSVTAPANGQAAQNAVLTPEGIAVFATASASSAATNMGPAYGNDNDPATRWATASGDTDKWFGLEWSLPVALTGVTVYTLSPESIESLLVQCWDGSNWQTVAQQDAPISSSEIELTFSAFATTKVRVVGAATCREIEAYGATTCSVGDLKSLPTGMYVAASGISTAVFSSDFYIESQDRSSAIKVVPGSGFTVGGDQTNIATGAVATSSSHWTGYGPEVGNDGDITTRYSALTGGDEWYELEWAAAQTFNAIQLYSWSGFMPSSAVFSYWDAGTSSWVDIGTMSPIAVPYTTLSFSPVTTTKIHMTNAWTFYELMVLQAPTVQPDMRWTIFGVVGADGLEKAIFASSGNAGSSETVDPLGMTNKALSTADEPLSTSGLLVTVWGKVTHVTALDNDLSYIYVDDGSGVASDIDGVYGVRVGPVQTSATVDSNVSVTGIARPVMVDGTAIRTIRPQSSDDVIVR